MGFCKIQQISLMFWLLPIVAGAQIIPDRSLGNETSGVLPDNFGKGRGGLPENPQDVLHSSPVEYNWLPFVNNSLPKIQSNSFSSPTFKTIADKLIRNDRGQSFLLWRETSYMMTLP